MLSMRENGYRLRFPTADANVRAETGAPSPRFPNAHSTLRQNHPRTPRPARAFEGRRRGMHFAVRQCRAYSAAPGRERPYPAETVPLVGTRLVASQRLADATSRVPTTAGPQCLCEPTSQASEADFSAGRSDVRSEKLRAVLGTGLVQALAPSDRVEDP